MMAQIQVQGFVPKSFNGKEFSLRVTDSKNIEEYYQKEKIDTGLRYAEGYPLISVSGSLAAGCKPGDRILLTVESEYRSNGKKGIRNVDLRVLTK